MQNSRRAPLVLALAAALLVPAAASGQGAGSITGTVTDSTGLILPGVTVEARDAAGVGQVAFTGGTGEFSFTGLEPGDLRGDVHPAGFEAPPQTVEVMAGATATSTSRWRSGSRSGWSSSERAPSRVR